MIVSQAISRHSKRTQARLTAERRYNHSPKGRMRAQRYYYSPKGYEAYFHHNEMKRADRQWGRLERDEPEVYEQLCRSVQQLMHEDVLAER